MITSGLHVPGSLLMQPGATLGREKGEPDHNQQDKQQTANSARQTVMNALSADSGHVLAIFRRCPLLHLATHRLGLDFFPASPSPRLNPLWDSRLAFVSFDLRWIPLLGNPFQGEILPSWSKLFGL
jgi:hypothetical protein